MEMIYGEGYLSAGGDEEVARIIKGIDIQDKRVLDVGCGLGGATVTFARDHGAMVTGLDIDDVVLARANELVKKANIADRVELIKFPPGPLPVENNSYDLAFVTAVTCHIRDLVTFLEDINRVLKSGGSIVGRDWFKINHNEAYRQWDDLLREKGLNFYFVTEEDFNRSLHLVGFSNISMIDRTISIANMAERAVQRVDNELKDSLIGVLGQDGYQSCRAWTEIRAKALLNGGIGQSQFRAFK